jgi:hypothetical protein
MSLILCATREARAQRLTHQEFRRLEYAWNAVYQRELARVGNVAIARRAADTEFDHVFQVLANERVRAAHMQLSAQRRLLAEAAGARNVKGVVDIGAWAVGIINRMYFDAAAMLRIDMADLGAFADEFRRTMVSGRRMNEARADNIVHELHNPGSTGDAAAQAMAAAWSQLNLRKVEQYNGAGGNITVRADYAMPQRHDSASIRREGAAEWIPYIANAVNWREMFNHDTGLPFASQAELEAVLPHIFEEIVSFNDDALSGAAFAGNSSNWRSRNDARFFVFNDGQAWLDYHARFGGGGHITEIMHEWLRAMNHDIVAMSKLGPNPAATVAWIGGEKGLPGGLIGAHAREASFGRPSLFSPVDGSGRAFGNTGERAIKAREKYAKHTARSFLNGYDAFVGSARRPHDPDIAMAVASVDNLMYAHHLAYTPFLTGADVLNQATTRAFSGVAVSGMFRDLIDAFRLSRDPQTLNEIGIETDVALHTMLSEARDMVSVHGAAWTRVVADRTMTWSGLKPLTMGLRAMWKLGVMKELSNLQGTAFNDLPRNFRDMLLRYDIDAGVWSAIQQAPRYQQRGLDVITAQNLAAWNWNGAGPPPFQARPGLTLGQEVAVRVQSMIESEGEYATVSGTPRSAAVLPYTPGTITGTIIGSAARLKTYAISHAQMHGARAARIFWRNGGGLRGGLHAAGYYAIGMILPSMAFVAIGTIAADIASGKEPPDVTDWKFWDRVFWRTISLGFFQDVFAGVYEEDSAPDVAARIAGPTLQALYQPVALGASLAGEGLAAVGLREDDSNTARRARKTAENYVPRVWWTDLAMKRLFWDNLQQFADPEADQEFRRAIRRQEREGNGFWWEPGADFPGRGPDMGELDPLDRDRDMALDN